MSKVPDKTAKEFVKEVLKARAKVEKLTGGKDPVAALLAAAEQEGYSFNAEELQEAVVEELRQDSAQNIVRYCFSEPPGI